MRHTRNRPSRTLIVVGHGSRVNARSALPVLEHLTRLRASAHARSLFDEFLPAYWKEEPSLHQVIAMTTTEEVVIVPLFMSDGYFASDVVPRQLGLKEDHKTPRDVLGRRVVYTEPIGTHHKIEALLRARLAQANTSNGASLLLVGHGTKRSGKSGASIHAIARSLIAAGETVAVGFLDDDPGVEEALASLRASEVIVAPFFVSEGLHTTQDIPERLGFIEDTPLVGRHEVAEKTLWYTAPVGTSPAVSDVILSRARDGARKLSLTPPPPQHTQKPAPHEVLLEMMNDEDRLTIGELRIERDVARQSWSVRHLQDHGRVDVELERHTDWWDAWMIARWDERGVHRPRSGAKTLRRGWELELDDLLDVARALDAFYPGALANQAAQRRGDLVMADVEQVTRRARGRWRVLRDQALTAETDELLDTLCSKGCTRAATWAGQRAAPGEICDRPCVVFLDSLSDRAEVDP